jgi:hypothetical protein
MRARGSVLLVAMLALAGCDRITGESDRKAYDAEAIGYACRVSQKTPEDCMKENEAQSPTSVLSGWKSADKDIREGKLDPSMGTKGGAPATEHIAASSAPAAEPEHKPSEAKPADKAEHTPAPAAAKDHAAPEEHKPAGH